MLLRRRSLAVIAIASLAAACGGDSTGPSNYQPTTLAQALAELSSPAINAGTASYVNVGAPPLNATTCPYSAATQSFLCPTLESGGLTLAQSFTLLSASGAKQSAFDPAGTAAVKTSTTLSGSYVDATANLTVNGQQDVTLSGLLTGPHTIDGTSSISLVGTYTDAGTVIPVSYTVNTTITGLVLPSNAVGSQIWPTSGTVVVDVTGSVAGVSSTEKTTITFSGSSTVDVKVTTAAGTQSCKVNLATADPVCA